MIHFGEAAESRVGTGKIHELTLSDWTLADHLVRQEDKTAGSAVLAIRHEKDTTVVPEKMLGIRWKAAEESRALSLAHQDSTAAARGHDHYSGLEIPD